ncbi:hypothetical protein HHK36_022421 [Tetracentron sinense]|uniref:GATA-type domain-containing protein n=1 Tax=Tetracentron sinense TaxID=13715 RepID=A0A834YQV6_TETSI|nr:hypothetical protein HHK36_022421 [Tetracentron sinense]
MESLESPAFFVDDLLDFSSDIGDGDGDEDEKNKAPSSYSSSSLLMDSSNPTKHNTKQQAVLNIFNSDDDHCSFPEFIEEELEWLSNADAFPAVETYTGIHWEKLSNGPVSVLDNSSSISSNSSSAIISCCGSLHVPVRTRSRRRRRRLSDFSDISAQLLWWGEAKNKKSGLAATTIMGKKCEHCLAEKTPQWRAGPLGPKTLCNACGVRFKSGRLVPEYRPASSPSFSSEMHSNSHRKIMEMRRQKQRGVLLKSLDKG